ncbi:MAG: hypothetical protein COA69_09450 [Robiginitomaculum sp.]|nr:MAG: hypothetical protein COA69_09450 [Robiginitomaculum sp.]
MPAINTVLVFEHGDESLLKCQSDGPGDTIGAWDDGSWTFDEAQFASTFKMYADGVEIKNIEIIYQTKSDIEAWPHISLGVGNASQDGVVSNTLEIWIEHDYIDRDATVTFSISREVYDQGGRTNNASTLEAATNLSTYKPGGIDQYMADDCEVVFHDPLADFPLHPTAIDSLGAVDDEWADEDTIEADAISSGTNDVILSIGINMDPFTGDNPEGVVFEIGSSTSGISVVFDEDNRFRIRIGTTASSLELQENTHNVALSTLPQGFTFDMTFHILPSLGLVRIYLEGILWRTMSGGFGDWTSDQTGGVGKIVGTHFKHSGSPVANPGARVGFDITSDLKYWDDADVTIAYTGNSKDWFPMGGLTLMEQSTQQSSIATYIDAYRYQKDDFDDVLNPGSINAVPSRQFILELQSWGTTVGASAASHSAVLTKGGSVLNTDLIHQGGNYYSQANNPVAPVINGESRLRPFIVGMYDNLSPVIVDLSATSTGIQRRNILAIRHQFIVIQDRMYDIRCSDSYSSVHGQVIVHSVNDANTVRIGGMKWLDCPDRPLLLSTPTSSLNGTQDAKGITFGENSFFYSQWAGGTGALFGRGGMDADSTVQRVQIGMSLFHNSSSPSSVHSHGIYCKGWIPYLRIKGGWFPTGPGGTIKADAFTKTVIEDIVSWGHLSGATITDNGNVTEWGQSVNRDEKNGGASFSEKVFIQNSLYTDMDHYGIAMNAAIDCEVQNCIFLSDREENSFYSDYNGSSTPEAEYYSDSYRFGIFNCTIIARTGTRLQTPLTDDRTVVNALGSHSFRFRDCIHVILPGGPREMFEMEFSTVDDAESSGRITDIQFIGTRFWNQGASDFMVEGAVGSEVTYATMAAAISAVDQDIFIGCSEGEILFAGSVPTQRPMEEYWERFDYADEDEFLQAIADSWLDGWSAMPEELKIENIRRDFAERLVPTNLGEDFPGYQVLPEEPDIPTVSFSGSNATVTRPFYRQPLLIINLDEDEDLDDFPVV